MSGCGLGLLHLVRPWFSYVFCTKNEVSSKLNDQIFKFFSSPMALVYSKMKMSWFAGLKPASELVTTESGPQSVRSVNVFLGGDKCCVGVLKPRLWMCVVVKAKDGPTKQPCDSFWPGSLFSKQEVMENTSGFQLTGCLQDFKKY